MASVESETAPDGLPPDARVSISVGYVSSHSERTLEQMLALADTALYEVKAEGKGQAKGTVSCEPSPAADASDDARTRTSPSTVDLPVYSPAAAPDATGSALSDDDGDAPVLLGRDRICVSSTVAWLGTVAVVMLSELSPDADRTQLGLLIVFACVGVLVAATTFALGGRAGTVCYTTLGLLTSGLAAVVIYLTGGATSPALPLIFLIVAFAASFAAPRAVALRIGVATLMFATPFLYIPTGEITRYAISFAVLAIASLIIAGSILYNKALLVRSRAESQELALRDAVTGIPNGRAFARQLDVLADRCRLQGVALCLVDLDNFKQINSVYGHGGGDELLRLVAAELAKAVRGGDLVARIGGDEFAVLLPGADPASAAAIAERCVRAVRGVVEDPRWAGCRLSASVGYSFDEHGSSVDALIQEADEALMRVKLSGKNAALCSGFAAAARLAAA